MEYVPKHTTENHFLMVLMVKSRWFVMAFVIYCVGIRIFCDGSIVFFQQGCLIVFIPFILTHFKGCCWLRSVFITTNIYIYILS